MRFTSKVEKLSTFCLFTTRFMEKSLKCMWYNDFYDILSIINCNFVE